MLKSFKVNQKEKKNKEKHSEKRKEMKRKERKAARSGYSKRNF